jgi:hypothetical protein
VQSSSRQAFLDAFQRGAPEAMECPDLGLDPDADFDTALHRLDTNTRLFASPIASAARLALALLALVSAVWLLIPRENTLAILKFTGHAPLADLAPEAPATEDPASRLLLHGDADAPDETTRWRALWESDLDNPVWFSRYASARLSEEKTVAPDLLADARRIEPDNGYWPLVAACINADEILEKTKLRRENGERPKTLWHANDEDEVLRRLVLIHEAAAMPRFESYQLAYLQAAIREMPPVEGFIGRIQSVAWLASQNAAATIEIRKASMLFEAGMRIAIEREDRELATSIIRDWHRLCRAIAAESNTMVDVLVAHVIAAGPADVFAEAIEKLGLATEAELLRPVLARIEIIEAHRKDSTRPTRSDDWEALDRHASMLAGLGLVVPHKILMDPPPPLSASQLRPDRRVEAAFIERMVIPGMAFISGIALVGFGVVWMRAGLMRRHIARRALLLVSARNLIITTSVAGAGPLLGYLLLTRFTSLGWLDYSFRHGQVVMLLQCLSLMCMMLFLPGLVATLALEKHATVLAWRWPGGTLWRKCAIALLILALPVAGLGLICPSFWPRITQLVVAIIAGAMLAIAVLALLWSAWRQRKEKCKTTPRRLAAGLLAAHARMIALVLLSAWLATTLAEEKSWAKRDTLMRIDPASPAITSYESQIQILLRQQVLDMLGPAWNE